MYIDGDSVFKLNLPKTPGGVLANALEVGVEYLKHNGVLKLSGYQTVSGAASSTLSLDDNILTVFSPSVGTGTHTYNAVGISHSSALYIVLNRHATRSFTISNTISALKLANGLSRTVQPGGCIAFLSDTTGSYAYEIFNMRSAS